MGSHIDSTTFAEKGVLEYMDDYIAADPEFDKDDIIEAFMDYCRDRESTLAETAGNIGIRPLMM